MTKIDPSSDNPDTAVTKKPYEKPSFRYEQVFVTTALVCGKTAPLEHNCQVGGLSAS
jgi:hypothetical protein